MTLQKRALKMSSMNERNNSSFVFNFFWWDRGLEAFSIRRLKQSNGLGDYLRNPYLPTKKILRTIEGLRAQSPSTT